MFVKNRSKCRSGRPADPGRSKRELDGDFRIGDWLVQPNLNRIVRDDQEVRVEPKAM